MAAVYAYHLISEYGDVINVYYFEWEAYEARAAHHPTATVKQVRL